MPNADEALPSMNGTDIAVVGAGLVGASLAWGFARAGASVLIFDAAQGDRSMK